MYASNILLRFQNQSDKTRVQIINERRNPLYEAFIELMVVISWGVEFSIVQKKLKAFRNTILSTLQHVGFFLQNLQDGSTLLDQIWLFITSYKCNLNWRKLTTIQTTL